MAHDIFLTPLYRQGEAAELIGLPGSTFSRWATGYTTASGAAKPPFVTVERPGRGYTVPFIGLAEAWIVRAFTRAGVPVARMRPALEQLRSQIGIEHALASDQLQTDGAEILWDLQEKDAAFKDNRLVIVRHGQATFGEVVREHLKHVDYGDGYVRQLRIPRADGADLTVDPRINFGQPTLTGYGIRRDAILDRISAGETIDHVAFDYDLPPETVANLALASA